MEILILNVQLQQLYSGDQLLHVLAKGLSTKNHITSSAKYIIS